MPLLNDRYVVDIRLYEGPRFEVLRARRRQDDQPVVLKLLKEAQPSLEQIARLRREAGTVRSVDSPYVVRCYGFETDGRHWALVQEDFGGQPIAAMIREPQHTLRTKLEMAISLVRGIDDVHSKSVIHKDINPTNVLWNPDSGELKIIDFGISTVLSQESPDFLSPNRLEGTLAYISPEQTGRTNAPVDYRTDYYSLGVTLYELFAAERPFASRDPLDLVYAHIAKRPVPLHERYPAVPAALGAVIMKLLEKSPKARYQSAYGILSDLRRCRDELTESGEIPAFQLAGDDVSERFIFPRKLYGRERDVERLVGALDRCVEAGESGDGEAATRSAALVLVTGSAGMGKSALVRELHRPITERRGYFITGKFEQFHREPYFAIVAAFRSLIDELLQESEKRLDVWRQRLADALGPNGRVITDVFPQVELIMGPQPELAELGPSEQLNRFNLVFSNFIHALARPEHPVVVFVDDLQWADAASLELLKQLLSDDRPQNLLFVGAYRDNEVDANHPLTATLKHIRTEQTAPVEISVTPLEPTHVARLLADTVATTVDAATPLAQLVARNTEGNPLFVREYLKALFDDGLLRFERSSGQWQWDLSQIEGRGLTESVLDLMVDKLKRLGPEAQTALTSAAAIGNRFRLSALASLLDTPLETLFETLLPALRTGVVVTTSEAAALAADGGSEGGDCRFFHDRVQQAAYSLLDDAERAALHLRIARSLLAAVPAEERGEEIFEIVDQLNRARELITDRSEQMELAELNLQAGRKAASSGAYGAAGELLDVALQAAADGWQTHHELTMSIHRELAMAEHLVGHHDRADELTSAALEHAPTELETAEILAEVVALYTTAGRYNEALETMHRGLKLISHELPSDDMEAAVGAAFGVVQETLGGATPASLLDRPTMSDPEIRAATRLLLAGMAAAFYLDPFLYILIICRAMALALEHGHPPEGVNVYAWYGHILSAIFGQPQAGHEFAELAVELSAKRRSPLDACRSYFVLSWIYCHQRSSHELPRVLEPGFQAGLESGDLMYAGYILYYMDSNRLFCGAPLNEIAETLRENTTFNEKLKNINGIDVQLGLSHAIANLRGDTPEPTDFGTEDRDEAALLARFESNQSPMAVCYFHVFKTMILGLYREFDEALEASKVAEGLLQAIVGNVAVSRHAFHTGLALAGKMERASEAEKAEIRQKLEGCRDQIGAEAEGCPENFAHMHALLAAELASLDGDSDEAAEAYQRAVRLAGANDYPQDRALANELAGRFRLKQDEDDLAAAHLSKAWHGYLLWGAKHKLRLLEDEFPELAASRDSADRTSATSESTQTTSTNSSVQLDLESVLRASQAISGEIVLDRLLQRLMALVIESAGADRGVLVVCSDEGLFVEANGSLETRDDSQHLTVEVQQGLPLESYDGVPGGVVRYALRTKEDVILGDASNEGSFTQDPYIVRQRPTSVACLPISKQGQLIGVLYLENKLTADAFTEDRVDLLRVLSAQFAISLENARLYANLEESLDRQTRITRSFERFVPKQFLEQLGHHSILEVELGDQVQREMTVLFMDVRRFTSLSESLSAKETFELLNRLLARLSPIIRRNGGFIDKYIGDAIMALFPGSSDGALTAALEIQRAVAAFREKGASDAQRGVHVGVGVHRGVTMLGTIGDSERMDSTVISDAVNIASRLEGLTKSRSVGIVISEQALAGAEAAARFVTRSLGQSAVKGRAEPIDILELMR